MVATEQIEKNSELNFLEHQKMFENVKNQIKDAPEMAELLLPEFYGLLDSKTLTTNLWLVAIETFCILIKNFSKPRIVEVVNEVYALNKGALIERGADIICMQNAVCAEILFNQFAKIISQTPYSDIEHDFFVSMANNMAITMLYLSDDEVVNAFAQIKLFEDVLQKICFAIFGILFKNKSVLRSEIWEKIASFKVEKTSDFSTIYKVLKSVIVADFSKVSQCLYIINTSISHPKQDSFSLRCAYEALGEARRIEQYKERADAIIMRGLLHPENSAGSKRAAYAELEKLDETTSRASMCQRVERTQTNIHGVKNVERVDIDEPAVLFLGGNGNIDEKSANAHLVSIEKLLYKNNIKEGVALYSAVFDFGENQSGAENFYEYVAYLKAMQNPREAKRIAQELNEDKLHAQYVDELFDKFFLKRLVDENGQRLSCNQACRNMRKLTVVAHCHGAYTFLKLEEKIEEKMTQFWYLPEERLMILHELMCIAHSPYTPLGRSKATMISFLSVQDLEIWNSGEFSFEMNLMAEKGSLMLSYLPGKQGEMFLASDMGNGPDNHKLLDYNTEQKDLNKNGQAILIFASNTIINSIKNSIEGQSLPTVKDIVCGQNDRLRNFFDVLQANGVKIWSKISVQLQSQNETNKE